MAAASVIHMYNHREISSPTLYVINSSEFIRIRYVIKTF